MLATIHQLYDANFSAIFVNRLARSSAEGRVEVRAVSLPAKGVRKGDRMDTVDIHRVAMVVC